VALVSLERIRSGYARSLEDDELSRVGGRSRAAQDEESESPEFSPFDQLAAGFSSGIDQQQALAGAVQAGIGSSIGDEEMKQAGFDYYRQQMEEASQNAPISNFDDAFDSLSDFGNFAFYTLGNAIPSLATTAVGGGIGGAVAKTVAKTAGKEAIESIAKERMEESARGIIDETVKNRITNAYKEQVANKYAKMGVAVGAGSASAGMGFGESFARIYEETGLEDPGTALVAGLFSGALDTVGAPFRAVRTAFPDNPKALTDLKEFIADEALTTSGRKRIGNMLTEGFKSAGAEGLTEASQEFISRASVMWAKENLSEADQALFTGYLFNEEAVQSYLHAATAGSIAGGALGSTIGGFKSVESEDGTPVLDVKHEEERQQRQLEAKKAVIAAAEAPLDIEPENPTSIEPQRFTDTLETIEISAGVNRDELAKDNGLTGEQQQEILDILIDQGRIKSEVSGDKIVYTAVDNAAEPAVSPQPPELEIAQPEELDLATRARMSAELFGEFSVSDVQKDIRAGFNPTMEAITDLAASGQVVSIGDGRYRFVTPDEPAATTTIETEDQTVTTEQTLEDLRGQVEPVAQEPTVTPGPVAETDQGGRILPVIGDQTQSAPIDADRATPSIAPLTDENRVIEKPTIENTNEAGAAFKITYPDSGNEYLVNRYPSDAGGGFFAFPRSGKADDTIDVDSRDIQDVVTALRDVERQARSSSQPSVSAQAKTDVLAVDQERRVSQPEADPKLKRDPEFSYNGEYVLTYPDGDVRRVFYDQEYRGWYDAEAGQFEGYLGENRKEAIAKLKEMRQSEFDGYSDQMDAMVVPEAGLATDIEQFVTGDLADVPARMAPSQEPAGTRFRVAGETFVDRSGDGKDLVARIAELNKNIGGESTQPANDDTIITQKIPTLGEMIRQLSGKGQAPKGKTVGGRVTELQPLLNAFVSPDTSINNVLDESPQIRMVMSAMADIFERGMPTDVIQDQMNGLYSFTPAAVSAPMSVKAINFTNTGSLGLNENFLNEAATNDVEAKKLITILAHEMWHAQDDKKKYSEYLPSLSFRVSRDSEDSFTLNMGDAVSELFDQWDLGTELGEVFNYPFTYLQSLEDSRRGDLDSVALTMRREVFAQLGATYISNPELLQQAAPKAYKLMRDIQRDPRPVEEIIQERRNRGSNANQTIQETEQTGQRAGVSGEVRAPTSPGGIQVPDDGRAGSAGSAGDQGQQAGEGLGDALTEPSGDESGRLSEVADDFDAIVEEKQYLYQTSRGKVRGKSAITKVIGPKNADKQLPALRELSSRHQSALDSPASWLRFERDLTGSNETLRPPHGLIKLYNNPEEWASVHSKLSGDQLEAARAGLNTAKELGELYEQGVVTPDVTAKLMLWGMMSRMLTASAQEAGFVDMVFSAQGQNRSTFEDFADKALEGEFTDADVADWKAFVPEAITAGSFGRAGTSNANDFGRFLQKMSEMDESGVTKMQKLHDLIADRSISSAEVRRQFQGMADNIGIDNKVFSFLLLMTGRDDVVILDRIQLNTMWDAGRYGKLIYDDIAENFNGLHGLARYEALEAALSSRIQDLYTAIGRPDEASVGRYHWESWVLNSGQVVAHPTMQGIVNDVRGKESPYAYLGAPEGKQNMLRYGAIYARDPKGEQYFLYPDSTGKVYRLTKTGFADFIKEIRKAKSGILPKGFKVSEYDKGFPWYEAEGVNRDNLDKLLESYAEREATEVERSFEETIQDDDTDGSRQGELDPQIAQEADDFDAIMDPAFSQASRFVETRNKLADEINEAGFPEFVFEIDPTDLESLSPTSRNLIRALERDDYLGFDRIDDLLLTIFDEGLDAYEVSQGTKSALGRYVNEVGGAAESMDFMLYDDEEKKIAPFKLLDDVATDVSLANRYKTKTQNVRQKVVDRLERLKQVEDEIANRLGMDRLPSELSAYDAENLMHSKAQKQLEDFEVEYVETIGEEIKAAGLKMDQVGLYLLAKHAPERNAVIARKEIEQRAAQIESLENQIEQAAEADEPTGALERKLAKLEEAPFKYQETGSGMTDADAQSVLDGAESEGKTDALESVSQRVYSMLDDMRQNMVDKGLLDEETRADWEDTYKFYVPLKGFASYPEGLEMRSGVGAAGFSVKGSESFKAKGRITLPVNPLLVSFKDAEEKIIRAERNTIAQRLLALLQQNESESNWQVWNNRFRPQDPENPSESMPLARMKVERRKDDGLLKYIQVKRGGQTFFIEVKDRELNRQLQSSGVGMFNNNVDFMNSVLTGLTKFQNFRRNMLINYNPSWGLVNPLRDIQTGLAFALSEQDTVGGRIQGQELIGKISGGYKASLKAFWRNRRGKEGANDGDREYDQYVKEYVEDGAPTGLSMTKSLAEQSRRFESILTQGDLRKKARYLTDLVEDYNQTMENAVRLSTYVEARKAGTARADAATLAKDLTVNFNRKGEYSSAIDSLYLFFNAAVQGNVNIAKAILRPGNDGQTITKARLVAGSMVAWGFARTLMNMDFGGEDDDGELNYADFNEYALKTSMVLINPFSETQQAYAIPMPYGYGIFDNIGRYGAELAMGVKTPQEIAVDLTSSVDHHFNPLSLHAAKDDAGFLEAAVQKGIGLTPDIVEAFAEQLGNINFFGSDITIPQNGFLVEKPPSEPTKRGTSEYITAVTRFLNQVTDGSEDVTGGLSVSPERVQHVVEFLLGGVGRFFDDSADTIAKLISEEPNLRSTDLPILRTFMPLPSEYSDRIDFYENRDAFRQHEQSFKSQTTREGRREVIDDRGYNIPQFAAFDQKIEKALRQLRSEKKNLENNDLIDPLKRYEAIERIAEQEERLYDEYNKRWRASTE